MFQDFPVNFQFYRDGLPDFRRSGQRIIVHDGENKAKYVFCLSH